MQVKNRIIPYFNLLSWLPDNIPLNVYILFVLDLSIECLVYILFVLYNFLIATHRYTVHIFKYKGKSLKLFIMLILTKKCNIVNNYIDIFSFVFKKWRYMCLLHLMSRLWVCLLLLAFEGVRMRRAKPKKKRKKKKMKQNLIWQTTTIDIHRTNVNHRLLCREKFNLFTKSKRFGIYQEEIREREINSFAIIMRRAKYVAWFTNVFRNT